MSESHDALVAESLSAHDVRLLPFLPYLLQDLWELGSSASEITNLLEHHTNLSSKGRVLDLGCGKGAVSIAIAKTFGCWVKGVDLMKAFITEAQHRARLLSVDNLCSFSIQDVVTAIEQENGYDVVIYGAVGNIFTSIEILLMKLKQTIIAGGYLVIDDAYTRQETTTVDYLHREQWYDAFRTVGLQVIAEHPVDDRQLHEMNRYNQRSIERRAEELKISHEPFADLLTDYIAAQRAECEEMDTLLTGVTWLLQSR